MCEFRQQALPGRIKSDNGYLRAMLAISSRNDSARPLAIMKRTCAMVLPG